MNRMAVTGETTAEQLWRLSDDGMRRELVDGELRVMSPRGAEHGAVCAAVAALLFAHVKARRSGRTFGAETGFVLGHAPDTVRAPDAAFVGRERADEVGRTEQFWPAAPDFAAEVASPSDRAADVERKARDWLAAGTTLVLVLDPRERSATVYTPGCEPRRFGDGDTLDLDAGVPGWRVAVNELFD